jgi:hypothetical protein
MYFLNKKMEDDVTQRRRKLAELRQKLSMQVPENPFSISQQMSSGENISDFVVSIAVNIHKKRTKKTTKNSIN